MKKILLTLLTGLTCLTTFGVEINGLYYAIDDNTKTAVCNGHYTGSSYYGSSSGDIVIPSTINYNDTNYEVTGIGTNAFGYNYSLESVELPNTIISIADYAFMNCNSLKEINIPNKLESVGRCAFSGCTNLKSVQLPSTLTRLGVECFYTGANIDIYVDNIETWLKISFDSGGHSANYSEFEYYYQLGTYRLFCAGELVEALIIPEGITSLKPNAFNGCTSLVDVTLPNSITYISHYAFANCPNLKNVGFGNAVTTIGQYCFLNSKSIKEFNLPETLTTISYGAFQNMTGLESITIPASVSRIYDGCFSGDTLLQTVRFEDSQNNIIMGGSYTSTSGSMFKDSPVHSVYLGRNMKHKDYMQNNGYAISPFANDTTLEKVEIGQNVTVLSEGIFANCNKINNVIVPSSVTNIGYESFYGCKALADIKMSPNICKYGDHVFDGCDNLPIVEGIRYADNIAVTVIDKERESYELKVGTIIAEKGLFSDCNKAVDIIISESLHYISENMFSGCSNLNSITIPETVVSIGTNAFENCSKLEAVNIPENIENILEWTFYNCESLKEINLSNNISEIGKAAFAGCSSLSSFTIPSSITKINDQAFARCTSIKKIIFEDGDKSLVLGKHDTNYSANYGLFYYCPLEEIYLGRSITGYTYDISKTSYGSPFYGQTGLKKITFGVLFNTSLAYNFFVQSKNIIEIRAPWEDPVSIPQNAFSSAAFSNAILYVPKGKVSSYKALSWWSNFTHITEESTTGVEKIFSEKEQSVKYNLFGIKTNNQYTDIIIVNGKKCILR